MTGDYLGDFVPAGLLSYPKDMAFGADGDLYVLNNGLLGPNPGTNDVYRFDGTTGASLGAFTRGGSLNLGIGFTFGPGGDLFVASRGTNEVQRFNGVTGNFAGVFASAGMSLPYDLAFGPDGNLYVASSHTDEIKRYNGTTGALMDTFASGHGLTLPTTLTFGPDGNLYVWSFDGKVKVFNGTSGAFIKDLFSDPPLSNEVEHMNFGPDGDLYVSVVSEGFSNHGQVRRYNMAGAYINTIADFNNSRLTGSAGLAFRPAPTAVPEPGAIALLLGTAVFGTGLLARRFRR